MIRNKTWLDARVADLLRQHNVALALTDTSFRPLLAGKYLRVDYSLPSIDGATVCGRLFVSLRDALWDSLPLSARETCDERFWLRRRTQPKIFHW